jgi:hypothetical protein
MLMTSFDVRWVSLVITAWHILRPLMEGSFQVWSIDVNILNKHWHAAA